MGETIDRERAAVAVYLSILYRMEFVVAAAVVPHPGAPGTGDSNRGIGTGASMVILRKGGSRGGGNSKYGSE